MINILPLNASRLENIRIATGTHARVDWLRLVGATPIPWPLARRATLVRNNFRSPILRRRTLVLVFDQKQFSRVGMSRRVTRRHDHGEYVSGERGMRPHCDEPFHRWGPLQNFSERLVKTMLSAFFFDGRVTRHYFGDFRRLNCKGRLGWIVKKLALGMGVAGGNENLHFSARVR